MAHGRVSSSRNAPLLRSKLTCSSALSRGTVQVGTSRYKRSKRHVGRRQEEDHVEDQETGAEAVDSWQLEGERDYQYVDYSTRHDLMHVYTVHAGLGLTYHKTPKTKLRHPTLPHPLSTLSKKRLSLASRTDGHLTTKLTRYNASTAVDQCSVPLLRLTSANA
jgi:hypothetical protein